MLDKDRCLQINIAIAGKDGGFRSKLELGGGVNGGMELESVLNKASKERDINRQAAIVGIEFRHFQPFRDANTRTGLLALYWVLMNAGRSIRRKPYPVWAWLDHLDDEYAVNPELTIGKLTALIQQSSFDLAGRLIACNREKPREEWRFTNTLFDDLVEETRSLSDKLRLFGQMSGFVTGSIVKTKAEGFDNVQDRRDIYTTQFSPQERRMFMRFVAEHGNKGMALIEKRGQGLA
jgi:hypothetical protein